MGEERPHKDKYPLYRGAKDDRSNLELRHNRHTAQAVTYSQIALSILVFGATITAFLYLILEGVDLVILGHRIVGIRNYICFLIVLPIFALLAGRRAYLSWEHFLSAQFIEEVFGVHHTSKKYKLNDKFKPFREYDIEYENIDYEKLEQFGKKRRYCLFLDKISKHIP